MEPAAKPLSATKTAGAAAVAAGTGTTQVAAGAFKGRLKLALAAAAQPVAPSPAVGTAQEPVAPAAGPVETLKDAAASVVSAAPAAVSPPSRVARLAVTSAEEAISADAASTGADTVAADAPAPPLVAPASLPLPATPLVPLVAIATGQAVDASAAIAGIAVTLPGSPGGRAQPPAATPPAKEPAATAAAVAAHAPVAIRDSAKPTPGPVVSPGSKLPTLRADPIVVSQEPASVPTPDPSPEPSATIPATGVPGEVGSKPGPAAQPTGAVSVKPAQPGIATGKRTGEAAAEIVDAAEPGSPLGDAAPVAAPLGLAVGGGPARQVASAALPLVRFAASAPDLAPAKAVDRPVSLPGGNGTTTLHLTPATLGAVTVAISRDADGLRVAIAATRPDTLVSLAADRHALQAVLTEATGGAAHVRVTLSAVQQPVAQPASTTPVAAAPPLSANLQGGFGSNGQHRPSPEGGTRASPAHAEFVDLPMPIRAIATGTRGTVDITA